MPGLVIPPRPGWRFLAQRIAGDGLPGEWLDTDLPLTDVTVTPVLSGPDRIGGLLDPEHARLIAEDERPLLDERRTLIHAELDGRIIATCVYRDGDFNDATWRLECAGMAAQPAGMAYAGEKTFDPGADPLDVVRHVWEHVQSQQASDLGLNVDQATTTPIGVGTAEEPYALNWWSTHDLGQVIDQLAASTPFDYIERHYWNATRTEVVHELLFGYPRLGRRQRGPRFVFGENIHTTPAGVRRGSESANHVIVLGAGEGRAMVRAETSIDDGRLRRSVVITDDSIDSTEMAHRVAARELAKRQHGLIVNRITVPGSVLGQVERGDEILVQGRLPWFPAGVHQWSRIVAMAITPGSMDTVALSLVPSGH